jgi:hypothetical protein
MTTIFRGRQWAVTNTGIETLSHISGIGAEYGFDAGRLVDSTKHRKGALYDWPVYMAEKEWVDLEDFLLIFTVALSLHHEKYDADVDFSKLEASVAEARRIAGSGSSSAIER